MAKPSEEAQEQFQRAHALMRNAQLAAHNDGDRFSEELAKSLTWFYGGSFSLAQGLRATYILLETVNRRLDALERGQKQF